MPVTKRINVFISGIQRVRRPLTLRSVVRRYPQGNGHRTTKQKNTLTAIIREVIRPLRYIYYRDTSCGYPYHPAGCIFENASTFLLQLEGGDLARCVRRGASDKPGSYGLCKPLESVSLLSLLLTLNEGVHPVSPDVDEQRVYGRYGVVVSCMDVVDQTMRSTFGEIHLAELCL